MSKNKFLKYEMMKKNWDVSNILSIQEIYKIYKDLELEVIALNNFSLDIKEGEIIAIMGPSGSGKTTLMKIITGLIPPTLGQIFFKAPNNQVIDLTSLEENQMINYRRNYVGIISQHFDLFESLSVYENILIPLLIQQENDFYYADSVKARAEVSDNGFHVGTNKNSLKEYKKIYENIIRSLKTDSNNPSSSSNPNSSNNPNNPSIPNNPSNPNSSNNPNNPSIPNNPSNPNSPSNHNSNSIKEETTQDFTESSFKAIKSFLEIKDARINDLKVLLLLEYFGLANRINQETKKLSGGEKQRVAICSALIKNPAIITADEPTGELDKKNSMKIFETLQFIAKSTKTTVIITSHDPLVKNYVDRVINMEDGRVLAINLVKE